MKKRDQINSYSGNSLAYLPGLDGLRAIAVLAVVLYHAGFAWLPGGFLGVEVFFVISGYLITTLLLADRERNGVTDLRKFWLRRAKRLLPALFLLLVCVAVYAVIFLPDEVARLRGDTLAALGYVTNWYLILSQQSYFEASGRPSLLRHLWSLAVEEQFYIVFPLVFAFFMQGKMRRGWLLSFALLGAVGSTLLMALLYMPDSDPLRIYYGTDTRATGLLFGVALALVWTPWRRRTDFSHNNNLKATWLTLLGWIGLAALGALFALIGQYDAFLYQGGFALVGLATALVIAIVVHPQAKLFGAVLGWLPLRWLGTRSYSIYLWHWFIFNIMRPGVDVRVDELQLFGLRLALTFAFAELSYRLVENPIRRGGLEKAWNALRGSEGFRRWRLTALWSVLSSLAIACGTLLVFAIAAAQPPARPNYLPPVDAIRIEAATPTPVARLTEPILPTPTISIPTPIPTLQPTITLAPTLTPKPVVIVPTPTPELAFAVPEATATPVPTSTPRPTATPRPIATVTPKPVPTATRIPTAPAVPPTQALPSIRVTAIGDSVMLGAAEELRRAIGTVEIDAAISRQLPAGVEIVRWLKQNGRLGEVVVIHLGSNGYFSDKKFDEMMNVIGGERRVLIVNVKVPREWEAANNRLIREGVGRFPNAILIDWYNASARHPEFFAGDGFHLSGNGQRTYASLIASRLHE